MNCQPYIPNTPAATLVVVPDGRSKTKLLYALALRGSLEPLVRQTAVAIVRTAPKDDHLERVRRLHRFVQDSIDYHREPVETFQQATLTLLEGGDCDDHVLLLCAMGWSLRYPFAAVPWPPGKEDDPDHYTCFLGYPPGDDPRGDARTRWIATETTIGAAFGERLEHAIRRGVR